MADRDDEWNGGKFPNRKSKGLALSEFLDDAGVNSESTSVGDNDDELDGSSRSRRPVRTFAKAVETVLTNPTLVIATVAALPLLLIAWGIARPRRKSDDRTDPADAP